MYGVVVGIGFFFGCGVPYSVVGGQRRVCRSAGLLGFGIIPGDGRVFSRSLLCNSWLVGDVCFGAHPALPYAFCLWRKGGGILVPKTSLQT